jgi:hypothetical protein
LCSTTTRGGTFAGSGATTRKTTSATTTVATTTMAMIFKKFTAFVPVPNPGFDYAATCADRAPNWQMI